MLQKGQEEERGPDKKKMRGQGHKTTFRRHTGILVKVFKRVYVTSTQTAK